jgi:ABC-2 type transport system permease protein
LIRAYREDPRWAIAVHVWRRSRRGAIVLGVVFGLFVYANIKAYVGGFPTREARLALARSMQSFVPLLGPTRHLDTAAGFTAWRVLLVATLMGAVWGLRTSTGLLRGEEDSGRWEMLLVGLTSKRRATGQALVGLGGALLAMFAVATALAVAAGRLPGARFGPGHAALLAVMMVAGAAMFLAVGALTSQLAGSRGQAVKLAVGALGAAYVIRMISDTVKPMAWLRWLSPIGWIEEIRPLRDTQPWALLPILALVAACSVLAVRLAGQRDLNAGLRPEGLARERDSRWLVGPISLILRLSGWTALAWLGGIALMAGLTGSLSRSMARVLAESPAFTTALGRLGVRRASEGFEGVIFMFIAIIMALIAASQVAAMREEESQALLDNLFVRQVRRVEWLGARLVFAAGLILAVGLAAGLFTWLGATSQHVGIALPKLLAAGLNASVPGLCVLGLGTLVLGVRPRRSALAAYGIVAWSFLINLLGALLSGWDWLRNSSVFAHMALAPAANPEWDKAAGMALIGLTTAVLGLLAFARRDIEYS